MFLACYAEKAGSGILDMIARCREAGLPEPDFRQAGGQFVQTIWRDWLTADVLAALGLNDRQEKAVVFLRRNGRIGNQEYQDLVGVTDRTALRDLREMVEKDVLVKRGTTGRATHYVLRGPTRQEPDKADSEGET